MDLETGAPKDELAPETLTWLKTLGVEYKKLSEILAAGPCPKVFTRFPFISIHLSMDNVLINVYFQLGLCCHKRWYSTCEQVCYIECPKDSEICHSIIGLFHSNR